MAIIAAAALAPAVMAASGAPLPRCDASAQSFYLTRYSGPAATGTPPTAVLDLATAPATGTVAISQIWSGATAPTVSSREIGLTPPNPPLPAGASVAGGMGKDGYIYTMRAIDGDNSWDTSPAAGWASAAGGGWRSHTRYYEMLRYGRDGVDNLGIVTGLGPYQTDPTNAATLVPGAIDLRLGPNFNAADIDPVTGIMYLANFQAGGALNRVFKIDVTQTPPLYVGTLNLSSNIPGAQSGDFAIDAGGQWAYGIATTGNIISGTSVSYRFNLSSGAVETLAPVSPAPFNAPYGAAARLPNATDKLAFYGLGTRIMSIPAGTVGPSQSTAGATSGDAAACLPKLTATLVCTPDALVDAAGNVSTCTVTLDQAAPAGGMAIALTPPAANPRYTSNCGSSILVDAGQTSASCTITATPNTTPGDGDVTAAIALATPTASDDYVLGTPSAAEVMVRNDDMAVTPLVNLSCTPSSLVDAASQVATCTISLSAPAPASGSSITLTPPAGSTRYTSSCSSPVVIAAGATESSCTITATPNTVVGDGSVTALVQLLAGSGYALGPNSQASVQVNDDDLPINPGNAKRVPTLNPWALALMGLLLAAAGALWLRRRHD
ncbi:IPTL-CTERM sorting domain-containing protein [Comamonas piscis]|uniref:IPTL-CTERM sorting domain-containing protein n=1 Tax=Comamonas piscis TaxID=1562974 RepID=A0A7G5EKC7_9BURK|nr:IPTL-CTERM sorting domain-containing protein [Comamonas piscis]QMV74452.1 IPTL-CTERM sorting domain-containing protein [Comamonas piscis]WSO32907.1 IPTL-CTERM sorting domain-containing protein [Comamonas piscis]